MCLAEETSHASSAHALQTKAHTPWTGHSRQLPGAGSWTGSATSAGWLLWHPPLTSADSTRQAPACLRRDAQASVHGSCLGLSPGPGPPVVREAGKPAAHPISSGPMPHRPGFLAHWLLGYEPCLWRRQKRRAQGWGGSPGTERGREGMAVHSQRAAPSGEVLRGWHALLMRGARESDGQPAHSTYPLQASPGGVGPPMTPPRASCSAPSGTWLARHRPLPGDGRRVHSILVTLC